MIEKNEFNSNGPPKNAGATLTPGLPQSVQPPTQQEPKYSKDFVSYENSTPEDEEESKYIEKILREDFKLFETREESRKREEVLNTLNNIVKKAVYSLAIKKGLPEDVAKEAGGKIFTFGSYRLGIVGPGDDIDVLCVGPDHADRAQFYEEMLLHLEKEKEITTIAPIREAHVPIIKIIFSGIPIDLLIARLSFKSIDSKLESLEDDTILKNCTVECIRSLNGCRVTNMILKLLPYPQNPESFRLTLRAIKLWAKKRGIYSNSIGYPGGVAWAILVAKVCKMFPNLKPNKLIRKFFDVYSHWNWSEPVALNEVKDKVDFVCPVPVWDPKDPKENKVITILTPAFPCQNTNHNTSETTKRVMLTEIETFREFTSKIKFPTNDPNEKYTWKNMFNEFDLFSSFNAFLQIDILGTNEKSFKGWFGLVESRIRYLINSLEDFKQMKVRPCTFVFKVKDMNFKCCKTNFFGIEFVDPSVAFPKLPKEAREDKMIINLRPPVKRFIGEVNKKRNLPKETNLRLRVKSVKSLPMEILQRKKMEISS